MKRKQKTSEVNLKKYLKCKPELKENKNKSHDKYQAKRESKTTNIKTVNSIK